jgi:urea transporter
MAARSDVAQLRAELRLSSLALLRGCGQLAFCERPVCGLLVLAGIALIAPFCAVGALLGAGFGTLAARSTSLYARDEWAMGLAGFNPAIVGLLGGGFLASGELPVAHLLAPLALSLVLDVGCRRVTGRLQLPALSVAAFTTVYLVSLIAAPPGGWFWTDAPTLAPVPFGLIGAAFIAGAMTFQCAFAALWALLLAALALLAAWLTGHDPLGLLGLWALTVPLASYGVHAVFLRGALSGCLVGTLAAAFAASIWIVWHSTGLGDHVPPLLVPFILGVWLSIVLMRPLFASPLTQRAFWQAVAVLAAARDGERQVVVLARDLACDGPGTSSFISGAWLDLDLPREAASPEQLRTSSRSRQRFWEACERLRAQAAHRTEDAIVNRLLKLQRRGWLGAVLVQDVLAPRQAIDAIDCVALHGEVEKTVCLDCKMPGDWPPLALWRRCDLRCTCQGPLVPHITPFGGALAVPARDRLEELVAHCAVVLVVGAEACEPGTAAFLEHARRTAAQVVFLSDGAAGYPRRARDLWVRAPARPCLELLYVALLLRSIFVPRGVRSAAGAARTIGGAGGGVPG